MTRFAKIPEAVLDALPTRLVGRYARIAIGTDFSTGEVRVRNWPELALLTRCSEREARRVVSEFVRLGVLLGNPPDSLSIDISGGTSGGTSDNTPSIQKGSEGTHPKKSNPDSTFELWADFVEGRRGRRPESVNAVPRRFAEVVRGSGLRGEELRSVCRLAGASYADWGGAVNYENAIDRGIEAMSRGEGQADMTGEEWLKS